MPDGFPVRIGRTAQDAIGTIRPCLLTPAPANDGGILPGPRSWLFWTVTLYRRRKLPNGGPGRSVARANDSAGTEASIQNSISTAQGDAYAL